MCIEGADEIWMCMEETDEICALRRKMEYRCMLGDVDRGRINIEEADGIWECKLGQLHLGAEKLKRQN